MKQNLQFFVCSAGQHKLAFSQQLNIRHSCREETGKMDLMARERIYAKGMGT
jgi:hypothetical protein